MSFGIVAWIAAELTVSSIISIALFVVSTVMQQQAAADAREAQRRQQEEAATRADAAKGTSIVVEGEITPLRVLYGRNLVGGNRVYHQTFNTYTHAAIDASGTEFISGPLTGTVGGSKHEFLITQQAICIGGIAACYNVDIDNKKLNGEFVNEFNEVVYEATEIPVHVPAVGHWLYDGWSGAAREALPDVWVEDAAAYDTTQLAPGVTKVDPYTHGLRVNVYMDGGIADPMMTANDSNRAASTFTNTAFATCVYRYNRDEPQFSGVPTAQFYVEGMKVYSIIGNYGARTLSASKTYSNNPALCLLDYLLSPLYGRGLTVSDIDLDSFSYAARVCNRVVRTNVPRTGGLWGKKTTQRDIYLYECNLGLDTSKPLRDNIETLLSTMGSVELVWSSGKYKLQLKYPVVFGAATHNIGDIVQYNNSLFRSLIDSNQYIPIVGIYWEDAVTAHITDDDIIRDGETSVSWPNAGTRLNFVTIRFLNESKDFKEDSVTWPPKKSAPGNAIFDRGNWNATYSYNTDDGVLYNSIYYRRLEQGNPVDSSTPNTAPTLWKVVVYNTTDRGVWNAGTSYAEHNKVSYSSSVYRRLSGGTAINSTPPSLLPSIWSLMVYETFKLQDSGIPLESEAFADGITTYYGALARAEQTVRESRTAVTYSINVDHNFIQIEPGDFVSINSSVLQIPGELTKVTEVKPDDKGVIKLSCMKFDAANLTWNVASNEVLPIRNIYDSSISQASNLIFNLSNDTNLGTLSWSDANDIRVTRYIVMYSIGTVDDNTVWNKIASTNELTLKIPFVSLVDINLTVISSAANDQLALRASWPVLQVAVTNPYVVTNLELTATSFGLSLNWVDVSDGKKGSYEVREGGIDWATATLLGETSSNRFDLNESRPLGQFTYRVRYTNLYGLVSLYSVEKAFVIVAPAMPANFLINGQVLSWDAAVKAQYSYPTAGYEIRVANDTNSSWEMAAKIGSGFITESPYELPIVLVGQKTILIKTVDTFLNYSTSSNAIYTDLGTYNISNAVETFSFDPTFTGTKVGCSVVTNQLVADDLGANAKLYGDDGSAFYQADGSAFYEAGMYTAISYTTPQITVTKALVGSNGYFRNSIVGTDVRITYTLIKAGAFYDADGSAFYQTDSGPFYGTNSTSKGPYEYIGPFAVTDDIYQFVLTASSGATQCVVTGFKFEVDAPDIVEVIPDLAINATATTIPYTKTFTAIKSVIAQLQANGSGAVTVEIDKTTNLAPTIKAYNVSHTAVSGSSADIQIRGY